MNPVRSETANFAYRGPTLDIGDVWVTRARLQIGDREYPVTYLDFEPTVEERMVLATGGLLRVGIVGMEPIPAVNATIHPELRVVDRNPPAIEERV